MNGIKEMYVQSPNMLVTDFMYGVSGVGCTFNVRVDEIPDYTESWESILIENRSEMFAAIRLSCDKTIDVALESGARKLIAMSALKG